MTMTMKSMTAAVAMTAAIATMTACGDGTTERGPSELRPGFTEILNLPFDLCTEEGTVVGSLLLRNIGATTVEIDEVHFEAVAGQESELSSFDAPTLDTTTLLPDDEAFVRFEYRVPGGLEQNATLVITSNAVANPRLEVPVATQELVPETPPNCDD